MNWLKGLSRKIRFDELLSKHTTFRIGGLAKWFFQPKDLADLRRVVIFAKKNNIRILVIGAGSNLLINDKGLDAMVIKLDALAFKNINYSCGLLKVGAGLSLSKLIKSALDYNLGGAEFLAGIPGTLGGALIMNAGISEKTKIPACSVGRQKPSSQSRHKRLATCQRGVAGLANPPSSPQGLANPPSNVAEILAEKTKNISDLVKDVTIMDYNGNIKVLKKKDIRFKYRSSSLSKYIVLNARLKLFKRNKREIRDNLRGYLKFRSKHQDYSYPSAGCVFKNPEGQSAGKLIDMCGLKGKRFGNACISNKHANFIINKGKAKAEDVLRLMGYIERKVLHKFGIRLEPEIKIWQ